MNGPLKRKYQGEHLDTCYFHIVTFCVRLPHGHDRCPKPVREPSRETTVRTEDGGQGPRVKDKPAGAPQRLHLHYAIKQWGWQKRNRQQTETSGAGQRINLQSGDLALFRQHHQLLSISSHLRVHTPASERFSFKVRSSSSLHHASVKGSQLQREKPRSQKQYYEPLITELSFYSSCTQDWKCRVTETVCLFTSEGFQVLSTQMSDALCHYWG